MIIQVKTQATKKYLRVSDIGLGLCRNSARCNADFTFKLTPSPHLEPTDKILIKTSGGDKTCLDPQPPYTLTEQSTTQTVKFSAANACEDAKAYWLYEVTCEKADGSSCGIEKEDPGVIIDGGPNA